MREGFNAASHAGIFGRRCSCAPPAGCLRRRPRADASPEPVYPEGWWFQRPSNRFDGGAGGGAPDGHIDQTGDTPIAEPPVLQPNARWSESAGTLEPGECHASRKALCCPWISSGRAA